MRAANPNKSFSTAHPANHFLQPYSCFVRATSSAFVCSSKTRPKSANSSRISNNLNKERIDKMTRRELLYDIFYSGHNYTVKGARRGQIKRREVKFV